MNRLKPGDKARVIGNEWVKCFKPPFWYQPDSGYIMDQDGLPVAEVRGWGTLQYQENPEALQDKLGSAIAIGLNSVLNDEVIATQGTVPQGTEAGIPEPIEPVQEEESQWIDIKETLPEYGIEVLWHMKDGNMYVDSLEHTDPYKGLNCTHWMPLPKPPISRLKSEIEELKRKA